MQLRYKASRLHPFRAIILLVGLILCIVVLDLVARKSSAIPISDVEKPVPCYGSLEKIIATRSIDRQIIVTVVNYAYLDVLVHWLYRLKRMNIHNFIVHVTDTLSAEYFQQHHLGVELFGDNFGNWFHLAQGSSRSVASTPQNYDVISQGIHWTSPNNRRNIGFFYLPCRPATLAIMTEVEKILTANSPLRDQDVWHDSRLWTHLQMKLGSIQKRNMVWSSIVSMYTKNSTHTVEVLLLNTESH